MKKLKNTKVRSVNKYSVFRPRFSNFLSRFGGIISIMVKVWSAIIDTKDGRTV